MIQFPAGRLFAEDEARHGDGDHHQRRDRQDAVKSQRRPMLRGVVAHPFVGGLPKNFPEIEHEGPPKRMPHFGRTAFFGPENVGLIAGETTLRSEDRVPPIASIGAAKRLEAEEAAFTGLRRQARRDHQGARAAARTVRGWSSTM
jgi:hypothetical protein